MLGKLKEANPLGVCIQEDVQLQKIHLDFNSSKLNAHYFLYCDE